MVTKKDSKDFENQLRNLLGKSFDDSQINELLTSDGNDFKEKIYTHLRSKFAAEKKDGETDEQFIYKTRKKGFGEFKSEFWCLSKEIREGIGQELERKTDFLFDKLAVGNTRSDVIKTVQQTSIFPDLTAEVSACN